MTDTSKTYNGWTNYETWAVNLWLSNDEGSYRYSAGLADDAWNDTEASKRNTRKENAADALAEQLKDMHDEAMPEAVNNTVFADLLNAALSEVNWYEIAMSLLEEYEDERVYDETDE